MRVYESPEAPEADRGTALDHMAFHVTDLKAVVTRLKAAGYTMTTRAEVNAMYPVEGDIANMASHHRRSRSCRVRTR